MFFEDGALFSVIINGSQGKQESLPFHAIQRACQVSSNFGLRLLTFGCAT
jgi:hypothetical protein